MYGKVQIFVIIIFCRTTQPFSKRCDDSGNSRFTEGNLGQIGYFPWLGILRVHLRLFPKLKPHGYISGCRHNIIKMFANLYDGQVTKIALTGLIYISEKFSIGNADDISRIPRQVLLSDSKAMFIPLDEQPWFCRVKDYMSHPEYEYSTVNTIALVELIPNEALYFPIIPICIQEHPFNSSKELYTVGYTDENQLLEKMVYKLQYVDPGLCDEFYNRAGFREDKSTPVYFQCGFAVNNKENCVWENGMALTSNSSGKWLLLGMSIKGPGCAAPARFIDLFPYIPWLESAMTLEDVEYPEEVRRAFHPVKKKQYEYEDIPAHALFRSNMTRSGSRMISDPYLFDVEDFRYFDVKRIDKDAIIAARFYSQYEANARECSMFRKLVYRELTKIVAPGIQGTAYFKLSLYDMMVKRYTCIKIQIDCQNRSDAVLYYKTYINRYESGVTDIFDGTSEDILKVHPIQKINTPDPNVPPPVWKPPAYTRPEILQDRYTTLNIPNINLWVKFEYKHEALLRFIIHGEPYPMPFRNRSRHKIATKKPRLMKAKKRTQFFRKLGRLPQVALNSLDNSARYSSENFTVVLICIFNLMIK